MSGFHERPAITEESEITSLPAPPEETAVVMGNSPVAEIYYPFLCAIISSILLLYCSISIILTIYKTTSLHNLHYFFVANLMATDIVFVLTTLIPGALVSLYAMFNPDFEGVSCKIMITTTFPHVTGVFMLVLIAFDNMLRIGLPFKYNRIMTTKVAWALVGCAWFLSLPFFIPAVISEDTERTKSGFCKWTDENRAFTYGIPFILSVVITLPFCAYLYYAVLKSWRDVRQSSNASTKAKLILIFQSLRANHKLAANLFLLSIVPLIFGFLFPIVKSLSMTAGGEDFANSPFLVYVLLPYIGITSVILRSVLFGFRLHSQVKVWSCKCLH